MCYNLENKYDNDDDNDDDTYSTAGLTLAVEQDSEYAQILLSLRHCSLHQNSVHSQIF